MPSSPNFAPGEMAERSIAAVLKTVEGQTSGGSNPSLSAKENKAPKGAFLFPRALKVYFQKRVGMKMEGAKRRLYFI
jgi:hypothetical protein